MNNEGSAIGGLLILSFIWGLFSFKMGILALVVGFLILAIEGKQGA